MNHPEIFAVPVLMIADYTLTILGAKEAAAVYRKHFVLASYELNPLWRKSVDQIRWFNPRHFALVCLVTASLVFLDQTSRPEGLLELMIGMFFGISGMICGKHLTNLLLFRFLNRNPGEITGQVHLSMRLTLKMSQFSYIGVFPLFVAIAVFYPHPYLIGVAVGVFTIAAVHSIWAWKSPPAGSTPSESSELN